jgi:ketosteroid isomerase-like protein
MQKVMLLSMVIWIGGPGCAAAQERAAAPADVTKEIITLERGALDRWIKLDPQGYLDLYTADVTYFDPMTDKRIDGVAAMKAYVTPMRTMKLPFSNIRYELIDPKVQLNGDVALLTFNVTNYGRLANEPENVISRWNSTEVYRRIAGKWKIIHSHW